MQLLPAIRTSFLSTISDETRLVIFDGAIALAGMPAPHDPMRNRYLVVRDGQKFVRLLPPEREVLELCGPYVIEPDLASYVSSRVSSSADSQLFLDGAEPQVVVQLGSAPGWRLFNLRTGASSSSGETERAAFLKWRVGVPIGSGSIQWVLSI